MTRHFNSSLPPPSPVCNSFLKNYFKFLLLIPHFFPLVYCFILSLIHFLVFLLFSLYNFRLPKVGWKLIYQIPGHLSEKFYAGSVCEEDVEEDIEEDEVDQEDYSGVVQGTTESLLNKLEETLAGGGERETLQECEPGDLEEEGKDIDQVLGIISNSIYRLSSLFIRTFVLFRAWGFELGS